MLTPAGGPAGPRVVVRAERTFGGAELVILALALACLFVTLLADLGVLAIAGAAPLDLFRYYGIAAATGWLFGNLYVARTRGWQSSRRARAALWSLTPVPPLFLLRSMASEEMQQAAPLAPLFACGVLLVLFLVPVSLRASRVAPRSVRLRRDSATASQDGRPGDGSPSDGTGPPQVGSSERA